MTNPSKIIKKHFQELQELETLHLTAIVLHHEMTRYNDQINYIDAEIKKNGDFPFTVEEIVSPIIHKIAQDKGFTSGFPEFIIKANLTKIRLIEEQIKTFY